MSIIRDAFKKPIPPGSEPTKAELIGHHCYQNELLADGFVSPMVLPCDRLKELQGDMSDAEMADVCRMPLREMQLLLENEYLEPSSRQLATISLAFGVSTFWLLGYHTVKDAPFTRGDREIMSAIGKRNAAESQLYRIKERGFMREILVSIMEQRINRLNRLVASTAASIVADQHVPLCEADLFMLAGQPVFIEYLDGNNEWGLVLTDGTIRTATDILDIEAAGVQYQAFQTPNAQIKIL